jgi:hypothetical protein
VISTTDIDQQGGNAEAQRKGDSLRCLVVPSEKSKDFFARLLVRRQTPGNCVRCGHKNTQPKYKTCPRCLEAVAQRKKAAAEKPTVTTRALERRVESLELAVVNLQMSHAKIYARAYNAGKKAALKPHRKYFDAYQRISKQELSTMNHAYARA